MTDQELADKVVALLGWSPKIRNQPGYVGNSQFLTDWRVAGALMEKCGAFEFWEVGDGFQVVFDKRFVVLNESLPRAIIEACVEALSDH